MDVLTTCTARTLKRNPVRTAVTVAGVALATALILAVATSALSLYRFIVASEIELSGSYNASALGATAPQLAVAGDDPAVTRLAAVEREGYVLVNENNPRAPYLAVEGLVPGQGSMQDFCDLVSLHLVEGALPTGPHELLLPDSLRRSGVLAAAVGDELTLAVGHRVGPEGTLDAIDWTYVDGQGFLAETLADAEDRTFTVCGFYADNATLFSGGLGGSSVAGLPALTVAAPLDVSNETAVYQVWLGLVDVRGTAPYNVATALFPEAAVYTNTFINLLTSCSFALGVYTTLTFLTVFLLVVVVAASVLFIRNSFAISVTERTRQFGLLSSVGATRRQLRGMVVREALFVAAVGVPIGVLAGYVGTAVVLAVCGDALGSWVQTTVGAQTGAVELAVAFSPTILVVTVVLAVTTTLLSGWGPARRAARFSAIDTIRSSADVRVPLGVRSSGKVLGRLFGVEGAIAAKSFRRAAKPRRATVASLVAGTALVVVAVLLGSYVNLFFDASLDEAEYSYDVRYHFYDSSIDSAATPREALDSLAASDDVTQAASYLNYAAFVQLTGEGGLEPGVFDGRFLEAVGPTDALSFTAVFVDDAAFEEWVAQSGLDVAALTDPAHPRAVAVNVLNRSVDGKYARYAPFTGEPFEAVLYGEVPADSPLNDTGYTVGSGGFVPGDGSSDAGEDYRYGLHETTVEVAAFADEAPWWLGTPTHPIVVLPLSAADAVDPALAEVPTSRSGDLLGRAWVLSVRSSDPVATEQSMVARLQTLGLSSTRLQNYATGNAGAVALYSTAQVFVVSFAVIVALIAVTGAFNSMHTGMGLRRREFAVLRSVGMTHRGLVKMLAAECLVYGLHVLAWSLPLCCLLSWLLEQGIAQSVATAGFVFPWAVFPCALGAFAVVALATAYGVRRNDDGASPVAALRTETA